MSDGVSPGGSEIIRHEAQDREHETTTGDPVLIETLDEHIERVYGDTQGVVFHELVSDRIHLDVHFIPPGPDRDWNTLVTCGMAERPMTVPEGLEDYRYAELLLALPTSWPLEHDAFADERHYWPIRLLKDAARVPHDYETFLYYGHTIPNGDPVEPYADDTAFCGALVGSPLLTPEEFDELVLPDGRTIRFFALFPLHASELEFKLEHGASELWERLLERGVTELINLGRGSVVTS